jgi:hypothetical protein
MDWKVFLIKNSINLSEIESKKIVPLNMKAIIMKTNGIGIKGLTFAKDIISFISLLLAKASIISE